MCCWGHGRRWIPLQPEEQVRAPGQRESGSWGRAMEHWAGPGWSDGALGGAGGAGDGVLGGRSNGACAGFEGRGVMGVLGRAGGG